VLRFVQRLPDDGTLLYCGNDRGASELAGLLNERAHSYDVTYYGALPKRLDAADDVPAVLKPLVKAVDRMAGAIEARYEADQDVPDLALPGEHNRLNASGALMACIETGADRVLAIRGIAGFGGAERRLQVLQDGDITVIDDYAHHPTEVEASIGALRSKYFSTSSSPELNAKRRLVVVYQPHLYSRTAGLIDEFAKALSAADFVVLTDIYPAREDPVPGVSSSRIAELLRVPHLYVPNRHLLARKVAALAKPGDVIVGMGAGNISEFAPALIEELDRQPPTANRQQSLKIVVAYGGDSAEREVSLHSGREVAAALKSKGYAAELIDFTEVLLSKGDLAKLTGPDRPDAVFLAVHGTHAEDGAIQGLLELLHIPYTGSGIQASALAMNKDLTKSILKAQGLRVPDGVLLKSRMDECRIKAPAVVKPNAQGSTVGLSFVENEEDLKPAVERAFAYDEAVLVEEWVRGMEISVPVLGDRPLPPVEIVPKGGRYDFASKYLPGATEEIVPARLPESTLQRAKEIALQAHKALNCEGATRTDMIVPEGDEPVVLEINTLPGMTATSLLPNSARAAGISFENLVEWMLEDALKRHAAKT
ncbi:MAG: D-alanine-D-alanine ligase, partial [Fimbriimonadaceae bacterium]|nr:D-alanine-D-alanine ligase [Fimbriimonadaceae bacterium]